MAPRRKKVKARRPRSGGRRRRRFGLVWLLKWSLVIAVWMAVVGGALVAWYATDLPDVSGLKAATRTPSVTLVSSDGAVFATYGSNYGAPVSVRELPPHLIRAVLATEDRRFYDHFGVDLRGLARAALANLRAGRIVQGGSTITQQLAKNLFLTHERTIRRKVQETLLALWLEYKFTKDEILTIYLNRVYFGAGTYGVDAAARKYFGTSAKRVTLYEAAVLAGLLQAPSRYAPTRHPRLADRRAEAVLDNMVEAGYLTARETAAAERQRVRFAVTSADLRGTRYFADWVLEQVTGFVGRADRDLVVVTTLDYRLQRLAEARVAALLERFGEEADVGQAALVALSPDGAVRAMVGGRDYAESQFNRATQALRQPGSAFKLFVYLAGLEAGLKPGDTVLDAPISIGDWQPENYSDRYLGRVTLETALAHSLNTAAVRVTERAGRQRVVRVAHRLGVTSELRTHPSLALGASEVTLIELAAAYATFANDGYGVWAHGIREIRDRKGNVLYRRQGSGPGRVVTPGLVATMNRMLETVIDEGTGRAARLGRPAAGKTGTSQEYRDAWFVGFTADLVTGVWMGNDDGAPMNGVPGGGLPARLWHDFMVAALEGTPAKPLPGLGPPSGDFLSDLLARIGITGD